MNANQAAADEFETIRKLHEAAEKFAAVKAAAEAGDPSALTHQRWDGAMGEMEALRYKLIADHLESIQEDLDEEGGEFADACALLLEDLRISSAHNAEDNHVEDLIAA